MTDYCESVSPLHTWRWSMNHFEPMPPLCSSDERKHVCLRKCVKSFSYFLTAPIFADMLSVFSQSFCLGTLIILHVQMVFCTIADVWRLCRSIVEHFYCLSPVNLQTKHLSDSWIWSTSFILTLTLCLGLLAVWIWRLFMSLLQWVWEVKYCFCRFTDTVTFVCLWFYLYRLPTRIISPPRLSFLSSAQSWLLSPSISLFLFSSSPPSPRRSLHPSPLSPSLHPKINNHCSEACQLFVQKSSQVAGCHSEPGPRREARLHI